MKVINYMIRHCTAKILYSVICMLALSFTVVSCGSDVNSPFDEPYVHIMQNDLSRVEVNSDRRDAVSYKVYFSPGRIDKELLVDYTITAGDGLAEGVDYEILTSENPLAFPPGIYERPIQIRWIDNPVSAAKDNSLTIKITGVNLDVSIGLPGPDHKQSEFVIEKVNN